VAERVRVLSIDGGGIRGIIPALVLAEIEKRTGRPIAELFELVAGTSTGGLIALALTAPGEDGAPAWSAEQVAEVYEERGHEIFDTTLFQKLRSARGLIDERYDERGLERVVGDVVGQRRLSDALTDLVITAYETKDRFPFFFRSAQARAREDYDFPMLDVALATSAAPTYFEARLVHDSTGRPYSLIDGGVFASNPAMCAYVDAIDSEPDAEVLLLSLGTGGLTRPLPWEQIKDWGFVGWARPLLDVIFDGVSDTTDHQLGMLLGESRYWRFQVELIEGLGSDDLDDARPENLEALKLAADSLLHQEESSRQLDEVCAALTA
jgi:uncharacterized protein